MSTLMTTAQALVRFLDQQYICFDGVEQKFVEGIFTIFGHGNVCGLGQALDQDPGGLKYYQGKNEQGMAHAATAFARQANRRRILAVSSSIGPGAANMLTAAGCATANSIPLLLLPGDAFASRQPDPVLQQVELAHNLTVTTNDAFKAVCKYWDRVARPEQLMTALVNAMRVLTDPAETGAVCVCLPQDVQGESYEYPDYFFHKRVHRIIRTVPAEEELNDAVQTILASRKPMVICGGGVKYSEAGEALGRFCAEFNIPFGETQAGKSAVPSSDPFNLGGMGVTGNLAANTIAAETDCVIAVGSRLTDFTTSSKWLFQYPKVKLVNLNVSRFDGYKMDAVKVIGDAQAALGKLGEKLRAASYKSAYEGEIQGARQAWNQEMERLAEYRYGEGDFKTLIEAQVSGSVEQFVQETGGRLTQTEAICAIREHIEPEAIIIGAAGSLPGDLQRMWTTEARDSYHMEYGYSCMGYEICGALGVKLAKPGLPVYAMVGDGSFYMMHSEFLTAIQEGLKITVMMFDNSANGCINNLQMGNGIGSLGTEFRHRGLDGQYSGRFIATDFAKIAEGYGAKSFQAKTKAQLIDAVKNARSESGPVLIDMKVLPKTMTDGYLSWWNVGLASVNEAKPGQMAYADKMNHLKVARLY